MARSYNNNNISKNNNIFFDALENWDRVNTDPEIFKNVEEVEYPEPRRTQIHEINDAEDMWDMGPRIQFGALSNNSTEVSQYDHVEQEGTKKETTDSEEMWDMGPRIQFGALSNNSTVVSQYDHVEQEGTKKETNDSEEMWDMEPRIQFDALSNNSTEVSQYDHVEQEKTKRETNDSKEMWDMEPRIQFGALSNNSTEVSQYDHVEQNGTKKETNYSEEMWDMEPRIQFDAPSNESTVDEVSQYDHVEQEEPSQNAVFDVEQNENFVNTWEENENDAVTTNGKNVEPQREIYIPPEPSNDEQEIFGTGIPLGINFEKFDQVQVGLSGENISTAVDSFEQLNLDAILMDNIRRSGYTKPTKIQKYSIPVIMAERDLMACAQTGSGKTAAFLIPILNNLLSDPKNITVENHIEPQVVIVSPTRELALQIYHEARKFAYKTGILTEIAYGGTSVHYQLSRIQKGCHVLVATPGRLNAFVKRGVIKFSSVRFLVLDEADRMLDMGFSSDMESILKHPTMVPTGERRTLMFSATFPEEIQKLAGNFMQNYVFVTVGNVGGASTDVQQEVFEVQKVNKRKKLIEILKVSENEKTLVFVETKMSADFIAAFLNQKNIRSTSIHGDRLQSGREEALRDFRSGKSQVLVATSVAARGLDIRSVNHVINYDLPKNINDYVHRIGRTGRIGNLGKATSFYDNNHDSGIAVHLAGVLEQAGQTVPEFLLNGKDEAENDGFSYGDRDTRQNSEQVTVYEEERWDV